MSVSKPASTLTRLNEDTHCLTTLSDTAQELLKFRLFEDSEGIWACCDECNKWRYAPQYKDPALLVNREFHCKEVGKKCRAPTENESDQVFYETKFCAGSLAWAKRPDGPDKEDWLWWPAIVEDSMDAISQYFLVESHSSTPIAYHITYLDSYRTGGWVAADLLKPFDSDCQSANKKFASRLGKKQRLLNEAIERGKNAAKFEVTERLEHFSYIAHMARLRGILKVLELPAAIIVNDTTGEPTNTPQDLPKSKGPAKNKKAAEAARKREYTALESTAVLNKKPRLSRRTVGESSNVEESNSAEVAKEISGRVDSNTDIESGYGAELDSPLEIPVKAAKKRATRPKKVQGKEADSQEQSEISSPNDEGSRPTPANKRKPRAKKPAAKNEKLSSGSSAPVVQTTKKKNVAEESESWSLDPLESGPPQNETKVPQKKKTSPKDSGLETQSENSLRANSPVEENVVSTSVPKAPKSKSRVINQDSEAQSLDSLVSPRDSLSPQSSVAEKNPKKTINRRKVLPKPSTKSFKKIQPGDQSESTENSASKGNKRPASTALTFTQPTRQNAADVKRNVAPKRRPYATAQGLSKTQPTLSQSRKGFAPPRRAKPAEAEYTTDDFQRDLEDGVI